MSDGVPLLNALGLSSAENYCKREVAEVTLVETPGGIEDEYLFKITPSSNPLPVGFKVNEISD